MQGREVKRIMDWLMLGRRLELAFVIMLLIGLTIVGLRNGFY